MGKSRKGRGKIPAAQATWQISANLDCLVLETGVFGGFMPFLLPTTIEGTQSVSSHFLAEMGWQQSHKYPDLQYHVTSLVRLKWWVRLSVPKEVSFDIKWEMSNLFPAYEIPSLIEIGSSGEFQEKCEKDCSILLDNKTSVPTSRFAARNVGTT